MENLTNSNEKIKYVRINNKNYRLSTVIFIISYFVFLFCTTYSQTKYETTYDATLINTLQWLAIFLCVVKIFLDDRFSVKKLMIWAVIVLLGLIISYKTKNITIVIPIVAYVMTGSNIDDKIVVKTAFWSLVIMVILTVFGSFIGLIPNEFIIQNNGRIRYSLGFKYTTFLANYFFHAVLMWLFLKRRCPNILESGLILILNFAIFYMTDTRAVFYEIILLIVVCWIFRGVRHLNKNILRFAFLAAFVGCMVIALGLQVYYDPEIGWMKKINSLLTSRLYFGHKAYVEYGISLLGQKITWVALSGTGDYFYVDSSYMNIAVNYGIILLAALIIGFTYLMNRYIKANKVYCCIALAFIALHSVTDPQLFSIACNPFLVLLGSLIPLTPLKQPRDYKATPALNVNKNLQF